MSADVITGSSVDEQFEGGLRTILAALDRTSPFMLSGGLDPANVAQAIAMARPWGVDVSSGVERAPGVKDVERIRDFVVAARAAAAATKEAGRT